MFVKPDDDLRTADGLVVPRTALHWTFARSGGAGGQHINKTSSKATLIVAVESVTGRDISLTRIRAKLPSEIRVTSQSSRSQWRNRQRRIGAADLGHDPSLHHRMPESQPAHIPPVHEKHARLQL